MIQMISIADLHPHKDNPRKDLGDLSELSESIKVNGIFQNLTVTPRPEGGYTVIIGHRRMEAAKLAGLTELPCAVVDMDERTQLSTMLLENMQRSDLTTYEQAQGFQLMFDLGMSAEEISDKSGFAVSTVKKRLKIATLPADDLRAAMDRGGTLEQYIAISEIKSEKERKKLLEEVGGNNFAWRLQKAKNEQERAELLPPILKELSYAKKAPNEAKWGGGGYELVKKVRIKEWAPGDFDFSDKNKKTYYFLAGETEVYVFIKKAKSKNKKPKKSDKEIEADRRREELKRVTAEAFELRKAFVFNFTATKKHQTDILDALVKVCISKSVNYRGCNNSLKNEILGNKDAGYSEGQKLAEKLMSEPCGDLAVKLVQYESGDGSENGYYSHSYGEHAPSHYENKELDRLYDFLRGLGYQMSDEEIALRDGTHELFGSGGD